MSDDFDVDEMADRVVHMFGLDKMGYKGSDFVTKGMPPRTPLSRKLDYFKPVEVINLKRFQADGVVYKKGEHLGLFMKPNGELNLMEHWNATSYFVALKRDVIEGVDFAFV